MNKKYIIAIILLVYTLIIFLPPIVHGYVYPNNGDDAAFHLIYFDRMPANDNMLSNYMGQDMIGEMLLAINEITRFSMDTMYLWFNFIVLWLVGISCFALVAMGIGWKAGLATIPVVMFMTPSTLNLFDTGAIFDLATVGVIAPLFLLSVVMYVRSRNWVWGVPALLLLVFSVVFHSMVISAIWGATNLEPNPSLSEFIATVLGYLVTLTFFASIFVFIYKPSLFKLNKKVFVLLSGLGGLTVLLTVITFGNFTSYSYRFAIDLAIIMSLLASCLLGMIIRTVNKNVVMVLVCAMVIVGSIPVVSAYCQYNSAVRQVDLEAIEYVNNLSGEYYSCSSQVAPWIYGRFIDKTYKDGELPYIYRNEPMSSRTNETSPVFWGNVKPPESTMIVVGYDMEVKVFKEGDLEVKVVTD